MQGEVVHLEQGDLYLASALNQLFITVWFSRPASLFHHAGEQSLLSHPPPLGKIVFVLSVKWIKIKTYWSFELIVQVVPNIKLILKTFPDIFLWTIS